MIHRKIKLVAEATDISVGPMKVKQPLPFQELEQVSPFLLLHHAVPTMHKAGGPRARLNPHPHRGFEPVTFLFSGKIHHRDSLGNEGFLSSGDVQWMTAGSGIIHSEGPSEAFAKEGGELELIQLWVNLPRDHKMTTPKYQDVKRSSIPEFSLDGFNFHLVAGTYQLLRGPATTFSPIVAMTAEFSAGAQAEILIPAHNNALVYVLDGCVATGEATIDKWQLGVFENSGDAIELQALEKGKLLLLSGAPIEEPVARYGPFVMNYHGEIRQAILDYETGKMGVLDN